jgi:hypothetical protein
MKSLNLLYSFQLSLKKCNVNEKSILFRFILRPCSLTKEKDKLLFDGSHFFILVYISNVCEKNHKYCISWAYTAHNTFAQL